MAAGLMEALTASAVIPVVTAPAVILVEPQLGENIGAAARAMLNCGLEDLRLVAPRDGWPSETARSASAGADLVIDRARVFPSLADAVADLSYVLATTARLRDMVKPVLSVDHAMDEAWTRTCAGGRTGILFGRERSGLTNDEVSLAQAAVTFAVNPAFSSLNIAQAVLLMAWEWRKRTISAPPDRVVSAESPPARQEDIHHLFRHLEDCLAEGGFFHPPEKRPHMERNLRNLLLRAELTEQDVRTLHGVVVSLTRLRGQGRT